MGRPRSNFAGLAAIAVILTLLPGCGGDPVEKVLKERARWKVDLLSFAVLEDGRSRATFRLSGPVKSGIDMLTIRIDMVDANDEVIHSVWNTFDVSGIQRGVPAETSVYLPPTDPPVEGVGMDPVLRPSEDDFAHIPELSGIEP